MSRKLLRRRVLPLVTLGMAVSACMPSIPVREPGPRAEVPAGLPAVAPCALVHATVEEDLSDGARGWFRGTWQLAYSSFLIRHPKGVVLVDAALGDQTASDIDKAPWWFRTAFGSARTARPLAALLAEAGVRPEEVTHVLVTHAHWDHTGGLPQLPNAKVVLAGVEADRTLAHAGHGHVVEGGMPHHLTGVKDRLQRLTFAGPAYEGFSASEDVFGDGVVVAVPTPGHTPGSTSYFVHSGDGRRWLFVGDAAWVQEGFTEPATKGRLASLLADHDREQTAAVLGTLHALHKAGRAAIVTAHDERTWTGIPRCPKP